MYKNLKIFCFEVIALIYKNLLISLNSPMIGNEVPRRVLLCQWKGIQYNFFVIFCFVFQIPNTVIRNLKKFLIRRVTSYMFLIWINQYFGIVLLRSNLLYDAQDTKILLWDKLYICLYKANGQKMYKKLFWCVPPMILTSGG